MAAHEKGWYFRLFKMKDALIAENRAPKMRFRGNNWQNRNLFFFSG
jgi:hypothetical protein